MEWKELFSFLAIILTFSGFVPYIISILRETVKPHVFSWIIWGFVTLFVFFAQLTDAAGAGAWVTGVSGAISIVVAVIAFIKTPKIVADRIDWLFLLLAFGSLPLWYVTSNPLWTVIILTLTDVLGFLPTLRKAFHRPFEESLLFFNIFLLRNVLMVVALENYSVVTSLFPVAISVCSGILIITILSRRKRLSKLNPI